MLFKLKLNKMFNDKYDMKINQFTFAMLKIT